MQIVVLGDILGVMAKFFYFVFSGKNKKYINLSVILLNNKG